MSASAVETVRERLDGILGRHSVVLSEELVSGVVDYVSLLPVGIGGMHNYALNLLNLY